MKDSQHFYARSGALAITGILIFIALLITQQWLTALMLFVGWELGYLYHSYGWQGFMRRQSEDKAQAIRDRANELVEEQRKGTGNGSHDSR